ncbi:MAG: hypothetical protein HRT47_12865 [Candidatus Caenarcaniphilales bacterium]|nr:hypothetical protein [Candidatus Caenarcaniphilales bacterium]
MSGIDFGNLYFGDNFSVRDLDDAAGDIVGLDGVSDEVDGNTLKSEIDGILDSTDRDLNSSDEKAEALTDLFTKVDNKNLDEAIAYLKKENSGLAGDVVGSLKLGDRNLSNNTKAWQEATSAIVSTKVADEKSTIKEDIGSMTGGELDNETVSKIYDKMQSDGATKEEALEDVKAILDSEGLDVSGIKSIKSSSSTSSTSSNESLDDVKNEYIEKFKDDHEIKSRVDSFFDKVKSDAENDDIPEDEKVKFGDPVRDGSGNKDIDEMANRILETKPADSNKSDEAYVTEAIQDIADKTDAFGKDVEVRATKYYEKNEDDKIYVYKDDKKIDNLFIDDGSFYEKVDGDYEKLEEEDGEITLSNGESYDVSDLDGKTKFQLHVGPKSEEEKVEDGMMDALELFGVDRADIKEARGDISSEEADAERHAVRDAKEKSEDGSDFSQALMVIAIIGAFAALMFSGGGQKHTVVGQPSYNPNAQLYGGGYGGGYQQPYIPPSTLPTVQAKGAAFQRTALMRQYGTAAIEQRLYGGTAFT